MSANSHDIKVLNSLIEGLIDCADGYRGASDQTNDPRYSQWFERRAAERLDIAEALKQEVRDRGGTPEDNGSILAKASRAFNGFAQAVLGSQKSVFEMVQNAEAKLKGQFENARNDQKLSATTRETIRRGLDQIIAAESDLAALSDYLDPHDQSPNPQAPN